MIWSSLAKRPLTGEHKVIIKLPIIDLVVIGKFIDGSLYVYNKKSMMYAPWEEVVGNIEWRPQDK